MKIKTTLRFHLTLNIMVKINKTNKQTNQQKWLLLVRLRGKGSTPALLVEVQTCSATMAISVAVLQEDGNYLPPDPAILCLGTYLKDVHPTTETLAQPSSLLLYL